MIVLRHMVDGTVELSIVQTTEDWHLDNEMEAWQLANTIREELPMDVIEVYEDAA